MELEKASPYWFTSVGHKVAYDSWDDYLVWGNNLERMWGNFRLFTWGFKKEGNDYLLQLIYVCLNSTPNCYGEIPDNPQLLTNYLERNGVEIKIKEKDVNRVKEWLIKNNPDPWGLTKLIS
jgi:hypothetical protein